MSNPYPAALRERAVRAYESSDETYTQVAERLAPKDRGGGWHSPVDVSLIHALVHEHPDRTTAELTRAYNHRASPGARVHRSSILRALQRTGYVFKKNARVPWSRIGPRSKPRAARSGGGFAA